MNEMVKRIFVGGGCAAIFAAILFLTRDPLFFSLFVAAIAILVGIALWEYSRLARAKGYGIPSSLFISCGVAYVVATAADLARHISPIFTAVVLWSTLFLFFIYYMRHRERALEHIGIAFFGFVYIALSMSLMISIVYFWGVHIVAYLIIVTKSADIAAYFIGKGFGKRKLAPVLSPKKTVVGAVAGVITASLVSMAIYLPLVRPYGMRSSLLLILPAVIGAALGAIGQVGDMAESLLKRDAGVKDSNRIPGLGGVLDMIDSLLFTVPALYILILFLM